MNIRFEIYQDDENRYWLVSVDSIRYEKIKENRALQEQFILRADAFKWLENRNIPSVTNTNEDDYFYEIYI